MPLLDLLEGVVRGLQSLAARSGVLRNFFFFFFVVDPGEDAAVLVQVLVGVFVDGTFNGVDVNSGKAFEDDVSGVFCFFGGDGLQVFVAVVVDANFQVGRIGVVESLAYRRLLHPAIEAWFVHHNT